MTDKIKMQYPLMEEMSKSFTAGAEQLDSTNEQMKAIAQQMADGALLGQGGAAFVEAINTQLSTAIAKLSKKFTELQGDVDQAMALMKAADEQEATSKFQ